MLGLILTGCSKSGVNENIEKPGDEKAVVSVNPFDGFTLQAGGRTEAHFKINEKNSVYHEAIEDISIKQVDGEFENISWEKEELEVLTPGEYVVTTFSDQDTDIYVNFRETPLDFKEISIGESFSVPAYSNVEANLNVNETTYVTYNDTWSSTHLVFSENEDLNGFWGYWDDSDGNEEIKRLNPGVYSVRPLYVYDSNTTYTIIELNPKKINIHIGETIQQIDPVFGDYDLLELNLSLTTEKTLTHTSFDSLQIWDQKGDLIADNWSYGDDNEITLESGNYIITNTSLYEDTTFNNDTFVINGK